MEITKVQTKPFDDQKPGTSGLRKPVMTFFQENYTENFIQSIFNAVGSQLYGRTLVVGGDGRFFMTESVKIIIQMAAANKVIMSNNDSRFCLTYFRPLVHFYTPIFRGYINRTLT